MPLNTNLPTTNEAFQFLLWNHSGRRKTVNSNHIYSAYKFTLRSCRLCFYGCEIIHIYDFLDFYIFLISGGLVVWLVLRHTNPLIILYKSQSL